MQVPIYALNQVNDERCEWLVPGMLQAKVLALCKTLHQRPRTRLVPLPDYAAEFCAEVPFAQGPFMDALLQHARERTQIAVQRNDFKLEQLPPHLFMNFRVVDEHGRQLAQGVHLASLKAEFGAQARSAFQALAVLKVGRACCAGCWWLRRRGLQARPAAPPGAASRPKSFSRRPPRLCQPNRSVTRRGPSANCPS